MELPKNMWFDQMAGGLVCNPTDVRAKWKYYTDWNAEALGHRFRRVEKSEVDQFPYDEPVVIPPVSDPTNPPATDPVVPGISVPTRIDIHIWHHEGKPEV